MGECEVSEGSIFGANETQSMATDYKGLIHMPRHFGVFGLRLDDYGLT
jgi:hypothetical protein